MDISNNGFGIVKNTNGEKNEDGNGNENSNGNGNGNGASLGADVREDDIFEPMSAMEELMLQKTKLNIIADEVWSAMHNDGVTNGFLKWLYEQIRASADGIDATATRLWIVAQAGGDAMLFELMGDLEE